MKSRSARLALGGILTIGGLWSNCAGAQLVPTGICAPDPQGVAIGCRSADNPASSPPVGQRPEIPGSAINRPAVEGPATKEADTKKTNSSNSIKATESTESSGDANGSDPCKGDSDCYQRRNLEIQGHMDEWARLTMQATWVQALIGVIGTIF